MITQGERITAVEIEVSHLNKAVSELREEMKAEIQVVRAENKISNEKLDKLLGLQNKGVGAFWLASSLFGTGLIGTMIAFFGWAKP